MAASICQLSYKKLSQVISEWQLVLIVPYTAYFAIVIIMMGYSSLFAGASLAGGTMLGMMLVKRRYVWRVFLVQIVLILLAVIAPYFVINLPNLKELAITLPILDAYNYLNYNEIRGIENPVVAAIFKNETLGWNYISEIQRSSAFFWRATHIYLALSKAIFIVYVFRTLLLILDNSKVEILQHANKDELTGLDNRRYGLTRMQQALADENKTQDYSVILLDLDLFKNINDSYGHEVGDQVLREVADVITITLANKAIVSRYGGEEFLIILPDTEHNKAMAIAERLRESIAQHTIRVTNNNSFKVTASLGLYTLTCSELTDIKDSHALAQVVSPHPNKLQYFITRVHKQYDPKSSVANLPLLNDMCQRLISIADKALYKAKDRGRNQVVSANNSLAARLIEQEMSEPRYGT